MSYELFETTGYDSNLFKNYEPNTTQFVRKYVNKDMVVFDIGANVGYYTLLFAELAKEVHSFEPTNHMETLKRNINRNGIKNVILNNIAVGDVDGDFQGKIIKNWTIKEIINGTHNFITLDTYVKAYGFAGVRTNNIERLDLIKIDVDSWDFEVLKGAEGIMKKYKPVILMELNVEALSYRNHTIQDVLIWIEAKKYKVEKIYDTEMYLLVPLN